jgi:predicted DNA-binding transcriptional regulator AlpA
MSEPFTFNIDYDRLAEAIARRMPVKDASTAEEFWGTDEIAKKLSLSRKSVYRIVKCADFPKPYFPTEGVRRWRNTDVLAWIAQQRKAA